jgi:tetratricopeptide (TPR) repeat protein
MAQIAHVLTDYKSDFPKALEMAQRAEKIAPKSWLTQDSLGWVHYRMGKVEDAIRILEGAKGLDPRAGRARYHLGVAYLKAGKKEPGLAELRAVLEIAPGASYALEAQRILGQGGL